MNRQAIIAILLTLVVLVGYAKTYKIIKTPVAATCVNISQGELEARKVVMADTATTVYFTMRYPKGESFRFVKESYLMDEENDRSMRGYSRQKVA